MKHRLAALLFALAPPALAESPHSVQAGAGITYLSQTDRMLSPRNYQGVVPQLGLAYAFRGERWMHLVGLDLAIGRYRSQPDFDFTWNGEDRRSAASTYTGVDIQYALGRRFEAGPWTVSVGGTSFNHASDMTMVNAILGTSHYLGAFELAPWASAELDIGERHHFEVQGWVPVAAWMGRNPYPIHNADYIYNTRSNKTALIIAEYLADGSLRTVNDYQATHLRVGWTTDLGEHWAVNARARLDWLHYAHPTPMVELRTGLDLALQGRF